MKICIFFFAVALATAQQFNQRREFNTAVRLAGPGFFQQGGSFAGRSSFDNNNFDQQRQSFTSSNNDNFQNQNGNFQSTSFAGDRTFGSSRSFPNNNQFESGTTSFQRDQQNRFNSFDSRPQNQLQNRQFQQNQQDTFSSNDFQTTRGNQFQSTRTTINFPQNRFQDNFNQQNSQNQFQTSFDRENSRNRVLLLENIQLTPSTRFQSTSGQQSSGISFQANRNQQNTGNQFQQSNLNQRNYESNFRSNDNNRFSSGSRSQSVAQVRSGSSFSDFNEESNGVFEPLNLPSGASALLGSISTSFTCADRPYGYYADQQNSCRVFHVCNPYLFSDGKVQNYQYSFMCGEGTVFDQNELTCKEEYDATPCQEADNFYFRNEQFGRPEDKAF
ncbi:GATA zinc finger domain-containing protein 14-like isoform X1 [Palaemon carinicauda]|uniref:GATA zinc finger domain-containing protein 14-like isoform X1 n=1 Tax=Palaemon carinicauda TaxID=392227 RepID=UPI0035B62535